VIRANRVRLPRSRASITCTVAAALWSFAGVAPARAFDGEFCGATVVQNVVLTEDQHCTGDGIIAGASGVTIDLGGFTLNGDGDFPDTGINVGSQSNVTIKNGTVRNFFLGIVSEPLLSGAPHLKLANVTSRDNITHGANINGVAVVIDKCLFLDNGFDGLLLTSIGGKLTRSVFAGSSGIGLIVAGTDIVISNVTSAVTAPRTVR
jgi:hypothetical protein